MSCKSVLLVGKTDDNVVLDMDLLMKMVTNGSFDVRSIFCGSGTPHRNMKPLRSDKTHMTGKLLVITRCNVQQLVQETGVYLKSN